MTARPVLTLKSKRFRDERENDWRRLERLLRRLEEGAAANLSDEDLLSVPVLYRSTLSSLSVARATSLDRALIEYLEGLTARAYFYVYGARERPLAWLGRFFLRAWPAAARALWLETLVATFLGLLGTAVAYLMVRADMDWYEAFMPGGMSEGRDPNATTQFLRSTLYATKTDQNDWLAAFAAFLFTHNAQIALAAFALGFAAGAPSALLAVMNGLMLGAIFALFASRGLGFELGGWLMIHGVTELFAITLASAAGLSIGRAVALPGAKTRLDAAAEAGRQGAVLMLGVVVMLFVAGILEGVGRQVILNVYARYAIAIGTGLMWLGYLYTPRGSRDER